MDTSSVPKLIDDKIMDLSAVVKQYSKEVKTTIDIGFDKVLSQSKGLNETIRTGFSRANKLLQRFTKQFLDRTIAIESSNRESLARLQEAIEEDREAVRLISDGLKAHRERHFENTPLPALSNDLLRLFWTDKSITWPRRRILDLLSRQYCFTKREFKEVHQNEIAKQASVSKSMIKQHLTHLLDKGLIERREGHGRIFYRINGELCATT